MRRGRPWPIRLAAAAEADFQDIIRWTAEQFGDAQASVYSNTIAAALTALTDGPDISGVKVRDEILTGLRTLHIARNGRRGRHLIMFRIVQSEDTERIDVLRILNDAMDMSQHV